ncbi:unnamed protein product [Ambrosiozyma monospora]|uniref:Unnamed protein product n=1 Tax=Ambrosiozyma monospora TaxID=43982 RepID=A0ACB5T6V0_AMBMO|nr:unnamed protein product [Ambrosiozyma monospora]
MPDFMRLTSMSIDTNNLKNIWFANCFKQFSQLIKLKLLISIPYERDFDSLNEILKDWKRSRPTGSKETSMKLTIRLSLLSVDDQVQEVFGRDSISLIDALSKIKNDFDISFSLNVPAQPLTGCANMNDLIS